MKRNKSKLTYVREHLLAGKSITPMDALRLYGSFRLAALIHILRTKENMDIETRIETTVTGDIYARYFIPVENVPQEKEGDKRGSGYVCSVCKETPVDALNGFDTCDECAAKL